MNGAVASEALVHTNGRGGGQTKKRPGLSSKGPHRFIGNEVAPVDAKIRHESPTVKDVKPGGEGYSERPGLCAVKQHRQECSIAYAHLRGTQNRLVVPQWLAECLHQI